MANKDSEYPTPVTTSSTYTRELDRLDRLKADKEATKLRIDSIAKEVDETKNIALSARNKASAEHACHQEKRMEALEERADSWDRWFKGVVITIVTAIVGIGSFMSLVYYTKADDSDVQRVKADVSIIKSDVAEVKESQQKVVEAFQRSQITDVANEAARLESIKAAMRDVVKEVSAANNTAPNRQR